MKQLFIFSLILIFLSNFALINTQTSTVSTYAKVTSLPNPSSCSCYPGGYTCSTSLKSFVATFNDPIPGTGPVTISSVRTEITGSLYCGYTTFLTANFGLTLNGVQLNPLQSSGSYACSCACESITNTTSFPSGLPSYKRGGVNTIDIVASYETDACFTGLNVTLTYSNSASPSATPQPSGGVNNYHCCVYIGANSVYSITCTTSSTCPTEEGYTLISQFFSQSCEDCFVEY